MAIRSSDQISIVDLTDGYSVNLSTDAYTFAGDTTKVKSTQTFTTVIYGYCGNKAVAAAIDTTALSPHTVLQTGVSFHTSLQGVCWASRCPQGWLSPD